MYPVDHRRHCRCSQPYNMTFTSVMGSSYSKNMYIFNFASQLRTNYYLQWQPIPDDAELILHHPMGILITTSWESAWNWTGVFSDASNTSLAHSRCIVLDRSSHTSCFLILEHIASLQLSLSLALHQPTTFNAPFASSFYLSNLTVTLPYLKI